MLAGLIDEPEDKKKFDRVYYAYKDMMFSTAMSVLHSEALANETVQDCLLKIAEIIGGFPDPETKKAKVLIAIIVRNRALDNLRAEHGESTEPIDDETEAVPEDVLDGILSGMGYRRLLNEIMELDKIYSDILLLRLVYGYGLDEICSLLNISESAAKSRLYRGRKILRERVEKLYSEE